MTCLCAQHQSPSFTQILGRWWLLILGSPTAGWQVLLDLSISGGDPQIQWENDDQSWDFRVFNILFSFIFQGKKISDCSEAGSLLSTLRTALFWNLAMHEQYGPVYMQQKLPGRQVALSCTHWNLRSWNKLDNIVTSLPTRRSIHVATVIPWGFDMFKKKHQVQNSIALRPWVFQRIKFEGEVERWRRDFFTKPG